MSKRNELHQELKRHISGSTLNTSNKIKIYGCIIILFNRSQYKFTVVETVAQARPSMRCSQCTERKHNVIDNDVQLSLDYPYQFGLDLLRDNKNIENKNLNTCLVVLHNAYGKNDMLNIYFYIFIFIASA